MMKANFYLVVLIVCSLHHSVKGEVNSCPTEHDLVNQFNAASQRLSVVGHDGQVCHVEHHHDDHDNYDDHNDDTGNNGTTNTCETLYMLCRTVIISLNLTTEDCLEEHNHNSTTSSVTAAQAYGYGFLMILFVSLCSLLGVCLVPLINSDSTVGRQTYEYVYAFMVAIGASALITDAVLHLIPHAFGLHAHEDDDVHDHNSSEESKDYIWMGCLVLLGTYAFFLLEVALHGLGNYLKKKSNNSSHDNCHHHHHYGCFAEDGHYSSELSEIKPKTDSNNEYDKLDDRSELIKEDEKIEQEQDTDIRSSKLCGISCRKIKSVAWLITVGDAVHNFADGLALGAAIAQSLTLGLSTMFALIFHEIPHELGDYVILVRSGLHWATALFLNFFSSLTAIVGFFIGVAISYSSNSIEKNGWILSITAGLFFYIALTDLLPDLIHGGDYVKLTKTGWKWSLRFFLINLGFIIAFTVLLVLALYEDDLNKLIG